MPFINIYNEDWIWLFLHLNEKKYLQTESVEQKYSNPYINYKEKITFQEFGEIIIIGILKLKEKQNFNFMTSDVFWTKILDERKIYLTELYNIAAAQNKIEILEIIRWLQENYGQFDSLIFTELFNNYFKNELIFKELYNSIRS
jgi:hypothetical protein